MDTLLINTSSRLNELIVFRAKKIVTSKRWQSNQNESENILEYIKDLVKDFNSLGNIIVVTGPGGFTSIRVGVTIANTLAYSLNIKVSGITLPNLLAQSTDKKDYLFLHTSTKKHIFVKGYGKYSKIFPQMELYDIKTLINTIGNNQTEYIGEFLDNQRHNNFIKIHYDINITKLFDTLEFTDTVEPFYGRDG